MTRTAGIGCVLLAGILLPILAGDDATYGDVVVAERVLQTDLPAAFMRTI
ncbi:MAG: hypothetical protein GF418_05345 [Chitinivibrionales bacterium]|nr:hypothetical protein [Chitinivibrionales bacterium]MBD3395036.1 hypothetical protein [Chitinivibrionales bacterium]